MRAMKKTVSVLLSLMLILGVMTVGMSVASAAETKTITITSDLAEDVTVDYVPGTSEQVTVTFSMQAPNPVVDFDGVIEFDKNVLSIAASNVQETAFPVLSTGNFVANMTKTDGRLPFNSSRMGQNAIGFDFTTKAVVATVVFDIAATANTDTAISLTVTEMIGTTGNGESPNLDISMVEDGVIDNTTFTGETTAVVTPEVEPLVDPSVFLRSYAGNFEGAVSLVHYFRKNVSGYNTADLTIKFDGPVDANDATMAYNAMTSASSSLYQFNYAVYAGMFIEPVTFEIYQGETLITRGSYSIEQYILDKLPTASGALKTFYEATLNYGAAVQTKFNYKTDTLANRGINVPVPAITADDIEIPAGVGVDPDLTSIGISQKRAEQGEFLADTNIILYYTVTDQTKFAGATATSTDPKDVTTALPFTKSNTSGSLQGLKINNVPSGYLDNVYTVTFSNGKVYKTSVFNRIKNELSKTTISDGDKAFFTAIYWYGVAASAFFGK